MLLENDVVDELVVQGRRSACGGCMCVTGDVSSPQETLLHGNHDILGVQQGNSAPGIQGFASVGAGLLCRSCEHRGRPRQSYMDVIMPAGTALQRSHRFVLRIDTRISTGPQGQSELCSILFRFQSIRTKRTVQTRHTYRARQCAGPKLEV